MVVWLRMVTHTELLLFLRSKSYQEVPELRNSGDFYVRGDTISWWPIGEAASFRYHFFDQDLEKVEVKTETGWGVSDLRPELYPNQVHTEHGTIRPGEYIVHPFHGVGIFERLETRDDKRFISLQYAGNDRLLFPFDREAELMPYIGTRHPRLTRLYSKSWQNAKERIQKDLIGIARGLLTMFAEREKTQRKPYEAPAEWVEVIESQAGFDLTEDQARTWKEIQKDFQGTKPMDRLIVELYSK